MSESDEIRVVCIVRCDIYQLVEGGIGTEESEEGGSIEIEIISELALIKEIIEKDKMGQNSYCYIFRVVEEKRNSLRRK